MNNQIHKGIETMKAELKRRFTEKFEALTSIKDRIEQMESRKEAIADNGRITRARFSEASLALDKAKLGAIGGHVSDQDVRKANETFIAAKDAHEAQLEDEAFAERLQVPTDELLDATREFKVARIEYFQAFCADTKQALNSSVARQQLINLFVAEIFLMSKQFETLAFGATVHYMFPWADMLSRVFGVPTQSELILGMQSVLNASGVNAENQSLNQTQP